LARLFMFQQVYFHKSSRSSEWMLSQILQRVRALVADGARLPGVPPALAAIARDGDASLGEYLDLDDAVLWTALASWRNVSDPILSDLAGRLFSRRLFKTYELYAELGEPAARLRALDAARGVAESAGLNPEVYVGLDVAVDVPFDDTNEPLTVIFPDGTQRKPGDVSFLLRRLRGKSMERVRLIFAAELREQILQAIAT